MWSFVFIIPALCINKMIGIKYDVTLPVAAGALFVAIPYSISLFAQWLYGWPNKPGYKKYIEALRPRRIYRLTKAVLEMLKYLQYGKLYFQWKSWYKNVDSNNKYCVKGNVLNMVQDISDSLMWVRENGHSFNLNKDNIVLVGHSAGAHLCALTALFLVEGADELSIEQFQQWEIANSIKGIIGLSGVYNVMDHYQHEKMRGIEYVSPMHKAMDGKEKFDYYSPTVLIKKLNKKQLKRVPPVGLVHGTQDIIVPVESSMKFSNILTSLSLPVSLYLLPKMDHTKIVTDLMAPQRHFYHKVFDCIKQEYSTFIGPF
ncbi:uncharacterized protein si:dkey-193c22.1 isoform X2 [Astyanax mexicanus]|uniref:uncharacterized protein si:dkey-193c22.1 isoform X2 n=1 Tax=Astyanax mexicanus TaxID=7994 RepID=UPI0020CAF402|nr:uncharacterized protein si:dkey-193c22.1 isoform X2 [Astyanax mexicanus]